MRRSENRRKTYRVGIAPMRLGTHIMLFLSLIIVFAGLISKWTQQEALSVVPSTPPASTPIAAAFDETVETREISIDQTLFYALQLGAFENEESARSLAQQYQDRGAAGYILKEANRFRVIASVYLSKDDAQAVRTQLKTNHKIDSYVYEIVLPQMDFKTSGMRGQLDVIEAVLRFFPEGILQMQKLSVALDQKEANQTEMANEITQMVTRAQELDGLITKRFTQPLHPMVQSMKGLLTAFTALPQKLSAQDEGLAALSGQMKYELVGLIDQTAQAYQAFMQ